MAKDIDTGSDMQEIAPDVSPDTASDTGSDLASDKGVDLNADGASKAEGLAKVTMMFYEAPPPKDYSGMATQPPDSAIYTEAPEHTGKTPEQIAAEMEEAWGYNDPATDNRGIEEQQPRKPLYGDSPK